MTPAETRNVIWGKDIGLGHDRHVTTTMTYVDPPSGPGFRAGRESGPAIDVPVFFKDPVQHLFHHGPKRSEAYFGRMVDHCAIKMQPHFWNESQRHQDPQ
ncbi:hypothetical protein K0M31_001358 [Melipona bicolor]|uniref:Uncharacterized protein n=1 Tax=Melipona bicolor TaxID=60889 RepID=A0AA40GFN3_9HYME|nr:hypothetical protein K0M31_001358 [Melipona bicolor]